MWTPALRAASTRLVPASTSTVRSSMVTLGTVASASTFRARRARAGTRARGEIAPFGERASALLDVAGGLVAEALDQRLHRPDGGVAQGAERVAAHVLADRQQELPVARAPLAVLDAAEQQLHPVGPLAAGGALAARLVIEELGQARHGAHHAGRL